MFKKIKINIIFIVINLLFYCSYGLDDYINQVNEKSFIGNIPNNTAQQ